MNDEGTVVDHSRVCSSNVTTGFTIETLKPSTPTHVGSTSYAGEFGSRIQDYVGNCPRGAMGAEVDDEDIVEVRDNLSLFSRLCGGGGNCSFILKSRQSRIPKDDQVPL